MSQILDFRVGQPPQTVQLSIQEVRRYASFIATSNHKDLLSDLSGNRRFICVEVTAPIDTNVTVNYRQLYAQAFHAVMKGERYWLDDADEALLKESNEEFRQVSPLEHLYQSCFSIASSEEGDGEWPMTMDIFNTLQEGIREKLPIGKLNYLGRLLKKMECTEQKIGERQSILLEKTLKIGYLCRENGFSTLILEVLYTCNVLIINVSVENADM